jgi:hypothetical protein
LLGVESAGRLNPQGVLLGRLQVDDLSQFKFPDSAGGGGAELGDGKSREDAGGGGAELGDGKSREDAGGGGAEPGDGKSREDAGGGGAELGDGSVRPARPWTRTFSPWLLVGALIIAVVSTIGLVYIWRQDPDPKADVLAIEAAKVLMQVLGVVLMGGLVSYTVAALQLRHQQDVVERQTNEQRSLNERTLREQRALAARQERSTAAAADRLREHNVAESEKERRHRDFERDITQRQDARRRLDALRHDLLEVTIANYNTVKRSRRSLRAAGYREAQGVETAPRLADSVQSDCIRELERIIDAELAFERLTKLAPLADVDGLEERYRACEEYLKALFREYEKSGRVPQPGTSAALTAFVARRYSDETGNFGAFADTVRTTIQQLHESLLEPIDLGSAPEEPAKDRLGA